MLYDKFQLFRGLGKHSPLYIKPLLNSILFRACICVEFRVDKYFFIQPPQSLRKNIKLFKVVRDIKKAASKDSPVLIAGDDGTYKCVVSEAIHSQSPRVHRPFISIALSKMPEEKIETEIFGIRTDGKRSRKNGKLFDADGGTLCIDDISCAPLTVQEKLYRFLKHKKIDIPQDSASAKNIPNTRVIIATKNNLKDLLNKRKFKKDLYDICSATKIKLLGLKDRKEDILPLAKYFLDEIVKKYELSSKEFSKDAKEFLQKHTWPGNVRELYDTVKVSALLTEGNLIRKKDLLKEDISSYSIKEFLEEKLKRYLGEMTKLNNCNLHSAVLSEVEKSIISIVLKETRSNQLKAAKTLGINRNTLRTKIREYKIRI